MALQNYVEVREDVQRPGKVWVHVGSVPPSTPCVSRLKAGHPNAGNAVQIRATLGCVLV